MKAIISQEPPIKIVPHKRHKGMYRLQWKDGSKSVKYLNPDGPLEDGDPIGSYGFYNLSRAKDILKNYSSYIEAMHRAKRMKGNSYRQKAA